MTSQIPASEVAHLSTVAEIEKAESEIAALDLSLLEEAREIFERNRKGRYTAPPLSDHDKRVGAFLKTYLNGATRPAYLNEENVSRDNEIVAHREALRIVSKTLAARKEELRYSEANQWVAETSKEWREICREIIFAAHRLFALEEHARKFLRPIEGVPGVRIVMGSTLASGISCLGTGDPLRELREAAIADKIVTEAELRKVQKP